MAGSEFGQPRRSDGSQPENSLLYKRRNGTASEGLRLPLRGFEDHHAPHGEERRGTLRRDGQRHPAGRPQPHPPAAVRVFQADVRSGHESPHRRAAGENRHLHHRIRGCSGQSAGGGRGKLQSLKNQQPHPHGDGLAENQDHGRSRLQGGDGVHLLL